jgi:integrase
MAYIRAHNTTQKRKGKVVKRYEVCWREPHPTQPRKVRARQESYPTRELAEARRDELNNAQHSVGGTAALADAKKAGARLFGDYSASWLDVLATRVADADDKLKAATAVKYKRLLEFNVLPELGGTSVGAIDAARCRKFRAALVNRPTRVGGEQARLSASTIKHVWAVFRAVLDLAVTDGALPGNPAEGPDFRRKRGTGDRAKFEHHPLKPAQLGALCAALEGQPATNAASEPATAPALPAYPVYALMVEFMAAIGLRASETAGLEVGDIVRLPAAAGDPVRMVVKVARAKERKGDQWVTRQMLKSNKSRRTVPLPPWLAGKVADYLKNTHPRGYVLAECLLAFLQELAKKTGALWPAVTDLPGADVTTVNVAGKAQRVSLRCVDKQPYPAEPVTSMMYTFNFGAIVCPPI